MNMHVVPPTPAVEQKHRTITLTNRPPLDIVEDNWPIIAEGKIGEPCPDCPWQWSIEIRVRQNSQPSAVRWYTHDSYIVYANYDITDETEDDCAHDQHIRVGHVLYAHDHTWSLNEHILAVADELRVRIKSDRLRQEVTHAVDRCFAALPAQIS